MYLRNKRIIAVLFGLVITSSTLFLAINVQSFPSSTQKYASTEAIYMIVQTGSSPIAGGSTDAGHEGQIDIFQYSHNLYAPASSAQGATAVSHTPLTVVKLFDEASVMLWNILATGEVLVHVKLLFYCTISDVKVLYYNITITSAQIVSILSDADIGTHYEMVSFIYGKIYWTDEISHITKSSTWS